MSSLRVKLTVALLFTALAGIIIIAVLVQQFTTSEFDTFISAQAKASFIEDVTAYYEVMGSWDNVELIMRRIPPSPPDGVLGSDPAANSANGGVGNPALTPAIDPALAPANAPAASPTLAPGLDVATNPAGGAQDPNANPAPNQNPNPDASPSQFALFDVDGTMLVADHAYRSDQDVPTLDISKADPIVVNGETVGYVMPIKNPFGRDKTEEDYLRRTNQMLIAATVGALILALLLSFMFARSLSRPLREITQAIESVSQGNLNQQVPVRSRDEIGQVAIAFNQMSADLARANQLRKQMTADIAHELRTPLSVIGGYLASMSEGLLKPTPERFKIMHDEAQHLQRLVEDLRTLSLADAGELPLNRRPVAASELIKLVVATFSHQAEQRAIALDVETDPDLRLLDADPDRILQVLSNLVSNALRHTPEQGQITVRSHVQEDAIRMSVQDTGPGIPPEHLPRIFERFYRAEASRHQTQNNESGLGLAIAKSIIEAHGGTITVESVVGSGTTFTLTFPSPVEAAH